MSSAPLDEDRLELLIRELDPEATGNISMEAFTRWMNGAYSGSAERVGGSGCF